MWSRRTAYLVSILFAAAAVLPWGLAQPRPLDDLRNFVFDSFQRAAPRPYDVEAPARVVGIDEESLKLYGQWPWPRTRLAELVDRLRDLGAAAIAFDFVFAEADRTSFENLLASTQNVEQRKKLSAAMVGATTNDAAFARAIAAAPVVLGLTLAGAGAPPPPMKAGLVAAGDEATPFLVAFPAVAAPLAALALSAQGLGATNWLPDRDQIVRRIPLFTAVGGQPIPSLALEALRVAQGETTFVIRSSNASGQTAFGRATGINAIKVGAFEIQTGSIADIRPRYSFANPARDISAARLLRGEVARQEIEGRIVFVGALAAGLGDVRATPLEPSVPGADIQAQIVESIAGGALLSRPDFAPGLEFFATVGAFIAVTTLLYFAPLIVSALFALFLVVGFFGASFMLFDRYGTLIDPAYPSAAILVAYVFGAVVLWRQEQQARRHVYQAFGKFVAPAVVDRLVEHPERLVLGGETRELSVLFADLRDFSALSERMSARELTQFMNDYLTPMTDAILEADGTIDKYMGDAILAFWNAPLDVADHPRKAIAAALGMRAALAVFNADRAQNGERRPVEMGVGLALGPCSVGNMGSIRRFDYSILGDVVNLASRLDGACKNFHADIIADSAMHDAAPELAWLPLGKTIVLGRVAATPIYTIAGDAVFARTPRFENWRQAHELMFAAYLQCNFLQAAALAKQLAKEAPQWWEKLYLQLGQRYSSLEEVGHSVDGPPVWALDSK